MKQVLIVYVLPFFISLTFIYCVSQNESFNDSLFGKRTADQSIEQVDNYIPKFAANRSQEDRFLKVGEKSETIYLLGSSELAATTDAIPYNFIPRYFNVPVLAIGHAGNQCLSIYAQLLAKEHLLNNAPIVIILSPGWFESKASGGTTSEVFLEFNSENFLNNILKSESDSTEHAYLYNRVSEIYTEFNSPGLELKLMNFKHRASISAIHQALFTPLVYCDEYLLKLKESITNSTASRQPIILRPPLLPEKANINWDSLNITSKEEVLQKVTNNDMGIADDYYTTYIHGRTGRMVSVEETHNRELEDFNMLMALLKNRNVRASFIISPLNAYYYKNLSDILPTMKAVENEIQSYGFPYLNLLTADTLKYDKAILHDIMHMSDHGWYQVDKFIADTYQLNQ